MLSERPVVHVLTNTLKNLSYLPFFLLFTHATAIMILSKTIPYTLGIIF